MPVAAVVVAAGRGSRFGGEKQFLFIDGDTVAARSVSRAREVSDLVVLVVPEGYSGTGEGADLVVTGGDSRAASVRNGLAHCGDADIVIVHDAARPNASGDLFRAIVRTIEEGADAVVPGLPVADTVKRVTIDGQKTVVAETLNRDDLVAVQTPQGFRRSVLERAHATSDVATDDAGLVEAIGGLVVVIPGEASNLKITHPSDLDRLIEGSRS